MFRSKFTLVVLILFISSFVSWHCTKIDTTSIGNDLIPAVDNVHTFDTSISVVTINNDSVLVKCDTLFRQFGFENALGFVSNDPFFGKTTAAIYLELKPNSFPFSFAAVKDSLTGDSIVLVLQHTRTFGDSTIPQKVNVYQLTSQFNIDSIYTGCSSFNYSNTLLGSTIYLPNHFGDTSRTFVDTSNNELRIKLSNSFASSFFSHDSSNWFKNDSIYKLNFPGLAVVPDASYGGNALSYFKLEGANTKLAIYYHYIKNGIKDTVANFFKFSGSTGKSNYVTRDRSGANINSHLSHTNDDLIYIQSATGSSATINIPDLNVLSNRIIHKAELVMESIPNSPFDPFVAPDFLYLETKDSSLNGAYHPIPCDFIVSSNSPNLSSFGGSRLNSKDDLGNSVNKYVFNITRYLQNFVTKRRSDMNLKLSAPNHVFSLGYTDYCNQLNFPFLFPLNTFTYGRVILGGGSNANPNYRMKLRIVYSRI